MSTIRALSRVLSPISGESLTSYIDRLAAHHKVSLRVMLKFVGITDDELGHRLGQRLNGYGVLLDERRQRDFSIATGLPQAVVAKMLFSTYDGIAIDLSNVTLDVPSSLRICAATEWAYFSGSHVCPHCIRDDHGAWQLAWKLPWSFCCVRHKCYLVSHCPACMRRLGQGQHDRSLEPKWSRNVPWPGHCYSPQRKGVGATGRRALPCSYDLSSLPSTEASSSALRVQEKLNQYLSGENAAIFNSQISALEYFRELRSLCALILYCAEVDDLGQLSTPEENAFQAFVEKRSHAIAINKQSKSGKAGGTKVARTYLQKPELMAVITRLASDILEATNGPSLAATLRPLAARYATRAPKERWAYLKSFRFSDRLVPLIAESFTNKSFDRAIGHRSGTTDQTMVELEPKHVPQLLWSDIFEKDFKIFFPSARELNARRFCSLALLKLCSGYTWPQSALQLDLPIENSISLATERMRLLRHKDNAEDAFGQALTKLAENLSKEPNKVNYAERRYLFSSLKEIPTEHWIGICRAAGVNLHRSQWRQTYAAVWLWATLTEGDWRIAPGLEGKSMDTARSTYPRLLKTLIPIIAPYLIAYGTELIEEYKRDKKTIGNQT